MARSIKKGPFVDIHLQKKIETVRATSDKGFSATLGWVEVALVCVFFVCIVMYLYPYKKAAKRLAQQAIHKASNKASSQ